VKWGCSYCWARGGTACWTRSLASTRLPGPAFPGAPSFLGVAAPAPAPACASWERSGHNDVGTCVDTPIGSEKNTLDFLVRLLLFCYWRDSVRRISTRSVCVEAMQRARPPARPACVPVRRPAPLSRVVFSRHLFKGYAWAPSYSLECLSGSSAKTLESAENEPRQKTPK